MSDILKSSISELKEKLDSKQVKPSELAEAYLGQINKLNSDINAYISVNESLMDEAKALDSKQEKGELSGKLAGIPLGIKDLLCVKGQRNTAGSKILENFVAPYTSTVSQKLLDEGALVLGKCNLDEFAMGSSNETSYYGKVKNPWNYEYVPGGSSGGSAAAVAAGMAAATIGTDTGGSVRQPASFCGIVGVKPTYGRVSRYGIVAFASSLDQAGPMTRTVKDAALMSEVISGHDPYDQTTAQEAVPEWSKSLKQDLKGLKIGLPKEYFTDAITEDTKKVVDNAIEIVKKRGAEVIEVSLPLVKHAVPVYYLVATSEASSNLSRYDGVRYGYRSDFSKKPAESLEEFYSRTRGEGFGSEVKRRIILGTYCLSSGYYDAYYKKACQVRRLIRDEFMQAFNSCDVMLSPVTTSPAFKAGERINDPVQMYSNDIFTTSTNLAGLPGMSVPGGFSQEGLPIGIQLTAAHFQEQKMFDVAYSIEQELQLKEVPNVL
ncbi:MAG: Asp-tRNA(Asn)/Glu-tRNA(Gln) amidotransferase subunit GatA [Bdellovibrionales bacterium]|nr:Asp-tRNA(Asn)/Glu-tRNA(Gln) amidotransferase subunit GatA [Bdellovibrionales bacterium]